MHFCKFYFIIILYYLIFQATAETLSFPTAEGGGRFTKHCRFFDNGTPKVIKVRNLNDSGAGSLRAALEDKGARIVVFDISGNIELDSGIVIKNPYCYIAGQTAPGDGICLKFQKNFKIKSLYRKNLIRIQESNDVCIRYLRLRPGPDRITRIEAEDLNITGSYEIANNKVNLKEEGSSYSLIYKFRKSGKFRINICYLDERNAKFKSEVITTRSDIKTKVSGWPWRKGRYRKRAYLFKGKNNKPAYFNKGDEIKVTCYANKGSKGVIDYLEIVDLNEYNNGQTNGISVGYSHNVIIDHCSVSWASDENVTLWEAENTTVQWCLISESLTISSHEKGRHGMGLIVGDMSKNITVHHNFFAHNDSRNPHFKGGSSSLVANNIIYNWFGRASHVSHSGKYNNEPVYADLVNNLYVYGPDCLDPVSSKKYEFSINNVDQPPVGSKFFLSGNIGPNRNSNKHDNWSLATLYNPRKTAGSLADYKSLIATQNESNKIKLDETKELDRIILSKVGVNFPKRDIVDKRVIEDFLNIKKGHIIDNPVEVGGWARLNIEVRSADYDKDNDGIADSFEAENGISGNLEPFSFDLSKNYTNIEIFVNRLLEEK